MEQIKPYSQEICLNENAQTLTRMPNDIWKITTNQQDHFTKTLIISAGVGSYSPKKHMGKNAAQFV